MPTTPGLPMFDRSRWLRGAFALAVAALLGTLMWRGLSGAGVVTNAGINCALGVWSMRLLIATLAVSPISRWTRRPGLRLWRRPLGLASFAFAVGHAVQYVIYAQVWPSHLHFLVVKPYLFVGSVATVLLALLAATSTNAMVRRLSPRVWKRLHLAVYVALPLSLVHGLLGFWDPRGEASLHIAACVVLALARWGGRRAKRPARTEIARLNRLLVNVWPSSPIKRRKAA
jgi:sulfoxide reductase heme-binding subunit YedZ